MNRTGTLSPLPAHAWARMLLALAAACVAVLICPGGAFAAITTIGSPLSVPATLNTAQNLGYEGVNTSVPPGPEAPNGVFHTYHFGADTAIWNVALANGAPSAPEEGQALKVRLEGCAEGAPDGPTPLNQIHFQDITPLPAGGAKVNLTSQPFEIPKCSRGGASGSTVTTYEPINMCMQKGDYIDFNDEGGYVANVYPSGVPYRVLGAVTGSNIDSFIKGGGTDNGATMSSSERSPMEGFSSASNEELMLQVEFGSGADATHICGGGTKGLPPVLPALRISAQNDGVNHSRITKVAIFCRQKPQCVGTATLTYKGATIGSSGFALNPETTSHVAIRLSPQTLKLLRKRHSLNALMTAVVDGKAFSQTITVGIF